MKKTNFIIAIFIAAVLVVAGMLGLIPGIEPWLVKADAVTHTSLLAETMQPIDSSIGYDSNSAYLTTTQNSTENGVTQYIGQVNLPDGATIEGVRSLGIDTDPAGEYQFQLFRYSLWNEPVYEAVTDVTLSGHAFDGGKVKHEATVLSSVALVDNANYSYGIYLVLPEASSLGYELGLLRFVIDTSYSTALPLVVNSHSNP